MNEIGINILRAKLKEVRELSEQINNELLSDAVQKMEEVLMSTEKIVSGDCYLDRPSVSTKANNEQK